MKTFFIINIFLLFVFPSFSQTSNNTKKDTAEFCIPYSVAQKILLDLNDYDRIKELDKLNKKEIIELNNKISVLQNVNKSLNNLDSLNKELIILGDEKFKIVEEENNDLKKEVKKMKLRNTVYNIVSAIIIVPLTYITLIK
jgi:2-methylcitrate dehydratase PrpD